MVYLMHLKQKQKTVCSFFKWMAFKNLLTLNKYFIIKKEKKKQAHLIKGSVYWAHNLNKMLRTQPQIFTLNGDHFG